MNNDDFNASIQATVDRSLEVLVSKNDGYSPNADKLEQFKLAAKIQGITPKEALGGMMVKHTTSVYEMIGSGKNYSPEQWNEKIGDHINYLLILRAIVEEEKGAGVSVKNPVYDVGSPHPTEVDPGYSDGVHELSILSMHEGLRQPDSAGFERI